MASSLNNPAWMEWMETLMGGAPRPSYAATLPPDCFHCMLDELPVHLVPDGGRRLLQADFNLNRPLFLNPNCILSSGGQLPVEITDSALVSKFAMKGTMAWVPDPTRVSLLPFWLSPRLDRLVRELRPGEPAVIERDDAAPLAAAGILVAENGLAVSYCAEREPSCRAQFQGKNYAALPDLLHPFHVAALRRYYRHQIRTGQIRLGDGQSPRRYVAHNEAVARFFHHQLAPVFSQVAGRPLKPSYVYFASYLSGAELKKHVDRAQCEYSITLCIDFSPEPAGQTPWPIQLDTDAGPVAVYQALGHGLAYRGTLVPHYRSVLPEGQTSTSIFFHYVPEDFQGTLG